MLKSFCLRTKTSVADGAWQTYYTVQCMLLLLCLQRQIHAILPVEESGAKYPGLSVCLYVCVLTWCVCHVVRMSDTTIPKQVSYGQLMANRRLPGGPETNLNF